MRNQIVVLAAFSVAALGTGANAQSVADVAKKAPPELYADAVIRLVEKGDLPPSALDDAFQAAKQAKEPVKLVAMQQLAAGRPGMREAALRAGLDTLSLEDRVVTLLAKTDPSKAAQMFQTVEHPLMDRRSCADPMIADDSAYYDMGGVLLKNVKGISVMLVAGPGSSPAELAGFAKLILSDPSLDADAFRLMVGALGLKMQTAKPDYRAWVVSSQELSAQLDALVARAHELGVPVGMLAEGARKLAVTQLSSPRCHEELRDGMGFVDWFNREFGKTLEPIRGDETIPIADLGSAKGDNYFETGGGKALSEQFQKLRAARGKAEWSVKLEEFLKSFTAWTPEGDPIDVFHQKMIVLHGLYQVIPEGAERDKLLARAIDVLKSGGIERGFPAEWEYQVRSFAESALGGRAKLMAAFRESGDAGLALYAAIN